MARYAYDKLQVSILRSHLTSPHLTSSHLTSPHLTSPHLTSPHLTSPLLSSPLLTSRLVRITLPYLTSPHLTLPHTSPHFTSPLLTLTHHTSPHSTACLIVTHLYIYIFYNDFSFQSLKVPSRLQELIDIGSVTIRSKPFSDNEVKRFGENKKFPEAISTAILSSRKLPQIFLQLKFITRKKNVLYFFYKITRRKIRKTCESKRSSFLGNSSSVLSMFNDQSITEQ